MLDETRARTPEEALEEHIRYLAFLVEQTPHANRKVELLADILYLQKTGEVSRYDALGGK
ncbi:hypothetical protein FJZ17_01255 [Candidatus Pacearchaeota archaeon]|nr:hypothetical protein [Candidatus Pacearchaeota archaeon]